MEVAMHNNKYMPFICLIFAVFVVSGCGQQAVRFERIKIADTPYEAASAFDVDKDGSVDIVSGEYWFGGPDFKTRHKICDVPQVNQYYDDFGDFPMDVDGDGYIDIVTGGWFGKNIRWRRNPEGKRIGWQEQVIDNTGNCERPCFWDVDGDGFAEVVPNAGDKIAVYKLNRNSNGKGLGKFTKYMIKESGCGHGLGFGDINGDGRGDFVIPTGWLEAPAKLFEEEWKFHQDFTLSKYKNRHASVPILVYDVDGDGLADLIYGEGHNYGLYWVKQAINPAGQRYWQHHIIDTEHSQYHDMRLADIDNDGQVELITGKRYHAHNGKDPGGNDPIGTYYFEINKGKFESFTLDYGPAQTSSGVGIYFWVEDITGNGYKDIIAPGKEGLYLFKNMGL
jgi:hypothetical protein